MAAEEVAGNAQVLHGPVAFVLGIDGMLSLVLTQKKKKKNPLITIKSNAALNTSLLGGEKVICNITTLLLRKKM